MVGRLSLNIGKIVNYIYILLGVYGHCLVFNIRSYHHYCFLLVEE